MRDPLQCIALRHRDQQHTSAFGNESKGHPGLPGSSAPDRLRNRYLEFCGKGRGLRDEQPTAFYGWNARATRTAPLVSAIPQARRICPLGLTPNG